MRALRNLSLVAFILLFTGCAEMISVTRVDQIQASQYRSEMPSQRPAREIASCMKEALRSHRDATGKTPYAAITFRDFQKEHEITLRSTHTYLVSGAEILFHIEIREDPNGGSLSTAWVHPSLLSGGGSQAYLNRLLEVVQPCLKASRPNTFQSSGSSSNSSAPSRDEANPKASNTPNNGVKESSLETLEKLKNLRDRGVITDDDFERKKKQILESL